MRKSTGSLILVIPPLACGRADFSGGGGSVSSQSSGNSDRSPAQSPSSDNQDASAQDSGAVCPQSDQSSFLNFESAPFNQANLVLNGLEFWKSHGVRFNVLNGGGQTSGELVVRKTLRLGEAEPAADEEVWNCIRCSGSPSRNRLMDAAEEAKVGRFILSSTGATAGRQEAIEIGYRFPVVKLSFDLIDVDGNESWTITPYDKTHQPIAGAAQVLQVSGYGRDTSYTGRAHRIAVSSSTPIYFVRLEGSKDISYFGFAFDNFTTGVNPACLTP